MHTYRKSIRVCEQQKEVDFWGMCWIELAQDQFQWRTLLWKVLNLRNVISGTLVR
jgi:hypothetical protein